jgi:hypothetical protein
MKKPAKKSKAAAKKTTKAKKVPRAVSGKGYPDAKRSMNPQATLELKKTKVREIGGNMVFAGRKWVITLKDKRVVEFVSREIAALSADELIAVVNP